MLGFIDTMMILLRKLKSSFLIKDTFMLGKLGIETLKISHLCE